MKDKVLAGLKLDLPALEQTAEGQLRGGFAMLGPAKRSGKGPNTTCSGNGSCSSNGTCIGNTTCDNNGYCVNTLTDSSCGGNTNPDPGVKNPNCAS